MLIAAFQIPNISLQIMFSSDAHAATIKSKSRSDDYQTDHVNTRIPYNSTVPARLLWAVNISKVSNLSHLISLGPHVLQQACDCLTNSYTKFEFRTSTTDKVHNDVKID